MKRISTLLIILGIIIAISPVIAQKYNSYKEEQLIEQWVNADAGYSENEEGYQDVNPYETYAQLQDVFTEKTPLVNEEVETDVYSGVYSQQISSVVYQVYKNITTDKVITKKRSIPRKPNLLSRNILGVIKISKIGVYLPIVEGANSEQLRLGIGHIPGTAKLGQSGNSALAGHRNYAFATYFNRLGELKAGDKVTLITKKAEYNYIVFSRNVVAPKDTSVLKGSKKENIITLITCTPPKIATHRLIVKARLVGTKNKGESKKN